MKRIDLNDSECEWMTEVQKKLDSRLFMLGRGHVIEGHEMLLLGLSDRECEELAEKLDEFLACYNEMKERSKKRVHWEDKDNIAEETVE